MMEVAGGRTIIIILMGSMASLFLPLTRRCQVPGFCLFVVGEEVVVAT
jgi:hypothetical protein